VHRIAGFSAIAAGAVLVVAGGAEGLRWANDKSAIDQDRSNVPDTVADVCATPVNAAAMDACQKSHDAKTAATLGWVFGAAGVALAGAGAWLVISAPHPSEASREGSGASGLPRAPSGLASLRVALHIGGAVPSIAVEIPY
jgi:hypothetical protein